SLRRHGCANSIVERDEPHAVAARRRHVAEHERRREHMLEARVASGELRHRAAAIDERDDRLRAFDRLLAADQTAVARRRFPVEEARIVAGHVIAKSGEGRSLAAQLEGANARLAQAILECEQPKAAHVAERRYDGGRLVGVGWNDDDARQQPEGRGDAHRDRAQRVPAPRVADDAERETTFALRRDLQRLIAQRARYTVRDAIVEHHAHPPRPGRAKRVHHVAGIAQTKRVRRGALDDHSILARKTQVVDRDDDHESGDRERRERRPDRRNDPGERDDRDDERQSPGGIDAPPGPLGAEARPPCQFCHQAGAVTRASTAASTSSAVRPSTLSSGARMTRCLSTAGARALTSSGVTKSRPSITAPARAARMSATLARGEAPRMKLGSSRVARVIEAMYSRTSGATRT